MCSCGNAYVYKEGGGTLIHVQLLQNRADFFFRRAGEYSTGGYQQEAVPLIHFARQAQAQWLEGVAARPEVG